MFCLGGLTGCTLLLTEVPQPFLELAQPLFNAVSLWPASLGGLSLSSAHFEHLPLSILCRSRREGAVSFLSGGCTSPHLVKES